MLDPGDKLQLVTHCFSSQNKPTYWIEDFCMKTTRMLKELLQVYDLRVPSYKPPKSTRRTEVSETLPLKRLSYVMKGLGKRDTQVEKNGVDSYLVNLIEPFTEDFDALFWWKCNCHIYPTLALLARDILAVQVAAVAFESTFSGGGRVLDTFQSSLHPIMAEALMCTRNWLSVDRAEKIMTEEGKEEVQNLEKSEEIMAGNSVSS